MSTTRLGELCVLSNIFGCNFSDVGFKEFCMGDLRGRGAAELAMSTRVGELCGC